MEYKPGAMGVHFINMALVGPKLDSTKPQVLLYEPVGDKLVLAGAEWFVPTDLAKTAPTILGHQLMGPMEGHAPIMPAELHHWDLHVWLWKDESERYVQRDQLRGEVSEDRLWVLVRRCSAEDGEAVAAARR